MVRKIQDHASGDKNINPSVYIEQNDKLEKENNRLRCELDSINLKHEREIQELISEYK